MMQDLDRMWETNGSGLITEYTDNLELQKLQRRFITLIFEYILLIPSIDNDGRGLR